MTDSYKNPKLFCFPLFFSSIWKSSHLWFYSLLFKMKLVFCAINQIPPVSQPAVGQEEPLKWKERCSLNVISPCAMQLHLLQALYTLSILKSFVFLCLGW